MDSKAPRRVKPKPANVAEFRKLMAANEWTAADVVARTQVGRSTVFNWLSTGHVPNWAIKFAKQHRAITLLQRKLLAAQERIAELEEQIPSRTDSPSSVDDADGLPEASEAL